MKRFGVSLAAAIVACAFAGCDSGGLKEGIEPEASKASPQPSGFKGEMEKNAGKMGMVKQAPTLKTTKPKANP
jgi:hypothetical protein